MENIKALFVLVNSGFSEEVIDLARKEGARGATILNARGVGLNIAQILGITIDSEREIVLSLVDGEMAERIMAAVKEKAGIKSPANGICFTLPVDMMTTLS